MARLQILELPVEHHGDDMTTPWILVIDQVPSDEDKFDAIRRDLLADGDLAPRLGARGVLVFEETIEIPANEVGAQAEPLLRVGEPVGADDAERAGITQIVYAHERTRLDLCSALLLSGDTPWRKLIEAVRERQRELAGLYKERDALAARLRRVRALSEQPKVVDASIKDPELYRHAYAVGIGNAQFIARGDDEEASQP